MARRTSGYNFLAANLVLFLQTQPFFSSQIAVLPIGVVYLGFWTDELFRFAVAGQAPFHLQSVCLVNSRHIIYLTMAGRASDAFCNVNTVVKIRVFGQIVDSFPFDRFIFAIARTYRFEVWAVRPNLAVAIHASLR